MRRLYCIEQRNDYIDMDDYFNFVEEAKNQKFAFEGGRDFKSFYFSEYEKIVKNFDYFINDIDDGDGTVSEIVNYYFPKTNGKKYSPKEIKAYKELYKTYCAEQNYNYINYICDILRLMTGTVYEKTTIEGYCQGDWAELIYPTTMGKSYINYIEALFFNTGTEYRCVLAESDEILTVDELNDIYAIEDYYDYTALLASDYKQQCANDYDLSIDNIIVYEISNYHTYIKYDYQRV